MFLSKLTNVAEAEKIIRKHIKPTEVESIPLEESYQRVLARDLVSLLDSPPFDSSAMDGYAVRAEDTFGFSETNPADFRIIDRIGAGEVSSVEVKEKQAVKISTGAPMPFGANAVVMEEYTVEDGDNLYVELSLSPGENVSPACEDFKKGDVVLKSGHLLRPQDLAIIASAGYDQVPVYRKPRVGVIITGSELVMPKTDLDGAQVVNSNHFAIKSLLESSLSTPYMFHCIDNADLVEKQFQNILREFDALVTTGGTAISKGDVVVDVAHNLGDVYIHGVTLRPGKPFAFGMINEKPVFMLSGYPVAAMVQFDVFVRKNIMKMQGLEFEPMKLYKKATRKIPSTLGRTDYIRAKIKDSQVHPLKVRGSGITRSMVDSDCYIVIPENLEGIMENEECLVLPYHSLKA